MTDSAKNTVTANGLKFTKNNFKKHLKAAKDRLEIDKVNFTSLKIVSEGGKVYDQTILFYKINNIIFAIPMLKEDQAKNMRVKVLSSDVHGNVVSDFFIEIEPKDYENNNKIIAKIEQAKKENDEKIKAAKVRAKGQESERKRAEDRNLNREQQRARQAHQREAEVARFEKSATQTPAQASSHKASGTQRVATPPTSAQSTKEFTSRSTRLLTPKHVPVAPPRAKTKVAEGTPPAPPPSSVLHYSSPPVAKTPKLSDRLPVRNKLVINNEKARSFGLHSHTISELSSYYDRMYDRQTPQKKTTLSLKDIKKSERDFRLATDLVILIQNEKMDSPTKLKIAEKIKAEIKSEPLLKRSLMLQNIAGKVVDNLQDKVKADKKAAAKNKK